MIAPNPSALWPLCLPFHSVKGFQLSLGLFTATRLASWRPQCLSSSRKAPVFPCVAKAMACTTQGRQNRVHSREIGSVSMLLKSFNSIMLWAPVLVQEKRYVLPVRSLSWKAWWHPIWRYLVWSCKIFAKSFSMFDYCRYTQIFKILDFLFRRLSTVAWYYCAVA